MLRETKPEDKIIIEAFVSPEVPKSIVQVREALLNILSEMEAIADGGIEVRITNTEPNTEEARRAETAYKIEPTTVTSFEDGIGRPQEIFMALVFTKGLKEKVIPYLFPGLPVEYELISVIHNLNKSEKKITEKDFSKGKETRLSADVIDRLKTFLQKNR